MKTKSKTSDPMYFFEYDETYEHHETHTADTIYPFSNTPLTFYDWYQERLSQLTATNETAKATFLKHCYHDILHYGIIHRSMGYDIPDTLLILQCTRLCSNYYA